VVTVTDAEAETYVRVLNCFVAAANRDDWVAVQHIAQVLVMLDRDCTAMIAQVLMQ
jgi:hypothetical protein